MKKIDYKLLSIIILGIVLVGFIIYGVYYAINNYNAGQIVSVNENEVKYTLTSNQLDDLEQPKRDEVTKDKNLPDTNDTLTELDFKNFKNLFNTSKKSILILIRTGCSYCEKYEPILKEALDYYNIKAYKINISNIDDLDALKLYDYINFTGTPTTYIIEKGNVTHTITGSTDLDTTKAFIEYFYLNNN